MSCLPLANPIFQLHTPQKKRPSRLTSQPRKQAVPAPKSHTQFSFWFGAREAPWHFRRNVTPAILNLRSSLFKEVTFPQSCFCVCLSVFLFFFLLSLSLGVITQRAPLVASNPTPGLSEVPLAPSPQPVPRFQPPPLNVSNQSPLVLRNFKVILNLEAYPGHFLLPLLSSTALLEDSGLRAACGGMGCVSPPKRGGSPVHANLPSGTHQGRPPPHAESCLCSPAPHGQTQMSPPNFSGAGMLTGQSHSTGKAFNRGVHLLRVGAAGREVCCRGR